MSGKTIDSNSKILQRPKWTNFATGIFLVYCLICIFSGAAAAVSGWLLVHPFDVIKVRAQIGGGTKVSLAQSAQNIWRNEGLKGMYSGLSAAVVRQLTYGNLRLGFYATFKDFLFSSNSKPSGIQNLGLGLTAGGIAAFISNPIEVSLVRMQADGKLPFSERRNYRHVFDALFKITQSEGVLALWKGASPTVIRAMVVNAIQVGGYEAAKNNLEKYAGFKDGVGLHLSSSLIAGFIYSFVTLPLDTSKTRMQTQKGSEYTSIVQTITTIARKEGTKSLWNGFWPYFARCGGHTVTMFLFLEQYKKLFDLYYF